MAEDKKLVGSQPNTAAVRVAMQKMQDTYMTSLTKQVESMNVTLDAEQKSCGMALLADMQQQMEENSLDIKQMDQTKLVRALQEATLLRLNANAVPKECYVMVRKPKGSKPYFDFGIMGDGYDKLLRKYGVGVKKVHPYWLVREHDKFTYPSFNGLDVVAPTWSPADMTSKVVRVVYPIEMKDGEILWKISEREDVKKNLLAHISQNLMFNKAKRDALLSRIQDYSLDEIFKDPEALEVMSPAWSSPQSRESMIIRKMRNNCTKPIQKDFGNAFIQRAYEDADEGRIDVTDVVDAEVTEKTGSNPIETPAIDAETGEVKEDTMPSEKPQETAFKAESDDVPF